jgi:uncharacterized protein YjbI with pentapeptide repeats
MIAQRLSFLAPLLGLWWLLKRGAAVVWWPVQWLWNIILKHWLSYLLLISLLSIYIVLFGIAFQRYENKVDRIESSVAGIYAQLGAQNAKKALERIPQAQKMRRPVEPNWFRPASVVCSLLCEQVIGPETVSALKDIILSFKNDLSELNLSGIDLHEADLREANLREADLRRAELYSADLREANLRRAELYSADLRKADLRKADLREADLREADLRDADLYKADLRDADLHKADLRWANLREVQYLTQEQLNDACADETTINLPQALTIDLIPQTDRERCAELWQ